MKTLKRSRFAPRGVKTQKNVRKRERFLFKNAYKNADADANADAIEPKNALRQVSDPCKKTSRAFLVITRLCPTYPKHVAAGSPARPGNELADPKVASSFAVGWQGTCRDSQLGATILD